MFCHFITLRAIDQSASLDAAVHARVAALIEAIPGLRRAQAMVPAKTRDKYYDDGPPPVLLLQLYYDRLEALEQAGSGPLQHLASSAFPFREGSHQAMWARAMPVPPSPQTRETGCCAYMVHYWGEPADSSTWHSYYLTHHPPIMARFPAIREIEICTRVDWVDTLPWTRDHHFQRNKVVFDDAHALEAALHSPVREEMKADRAHFPPFTGGSAHFAMDCETILGPRFMPGSEPEEACV